MTAKLVAEEGELKGLVLSLEGEGEWVIGRDPDLCQLLVEDLSASRKHLLCKSSPEGILIENLSDTNPARVNDEVVSRPLILNNGDSVTIGSGTFRFYSAEKAEVEEEIEEEPVEEEIEEEPVEEEMKEVLDPPQEEEIEEEIVEEPEPVEEEKEEVIEEETPEAPEIEDSDTEEDTIFDEEDNEEIGIAEIDFGVIETGRWLLKVISGPNNGAEFNMQSGEDYVIGTDPTTCDIVFHDNSVSRKHCRISISDDDAVKIDDLKSRNGTLVDGEPLQELRDLPSSIVVTLGTTSFVVYDREGEMQTIISPLLPDIVNKLKHTEDETSEEDIEDDKVADHEPEEKKESASSGIIMGLIVIGIFSFAGFGLYQLFQDEPAKVAEKMDATKLIKEAMAPFPSVSDYFNPKTGQLTLVGHLLSPQDKNRLLYNLQGLSFIKQIDDTGVVVDQLIYREMNRVLERKQWRGVNMYAPQPGKFVISGYLKTRDESEALSDYISANFPYPELLENRVTVEENVISTIQIALQNHGIRDISVKMNNGEVTLAGGITKKEVDAYNVLLKEFKEIPGVRSIKNFVSELAPEEAVINISDRYQVSGFSARGDERNVVINGRILFQGDILDGMTITEIRPNMILLERSGSRYRIDF